MNDALIGYTGFVGSTLQRQHAFAHLYNSRNIEELHGKQFDTVFCAGAPAQKWVANQQPEKDNANITKLCDDLSRCQAKRFVLISTVDVYGDVAGVDENTPTQPETLAPYGKHRLQLEHFVRDHFAQHLIIRLPALFGQGLKKNFVFDLLNSRCLDLTDARSVFQFYDLSRLYADCHKVMAAGITLANFAVEPTPCHEIAKRCFDIDFTNHTEHPPVCYDMHTKHAALFGQSGPYLMGADEVYAALRQFVDTARQERAAS